MDAYPVVALRRFPVKAMGGEAVDTADLDERGLLGDRWYAVTDDEGHFATGKNSRRFRRHDEIFEYTATTRADGTVEVTGRGGSWTAGHDALDDELSRAFGAGVRVLPEQQVSHYDAAPVSLVGTASLRWCRDELGIDADWRRLRSNILIETDDPFVEDGWVGRPLRVGSTTLLVTETTERCRMIDVAHDGFEPRDRFLKALGERRELMLAVYAEVVEPGTIAVGDEVRPD
jgi:uncharacterized protein